jgi:hypothetical protein
MEQPGSLLYGSRLRNVGLRLKLFPYGLVDTGDPTKTNFTHIEFYTNAVYQATVSSTVFNRGVAIDMVNALA